MPFAVRRVSDGAFLSRNRAFVEGLENARTYADSGAAQNSVRQNVREDGEFEVVELETRIVRTKTTLKIERDPDRPWKPTVTKTEGRPRSTFRHVG